MFEEAVDEHKVYLVLFGQFGEASHVQFEDGACPDILLEEDGQIGLVIKHVPLFGIVGLKLVGLELIGEFDGFEELGGLVEEMGFDKA